MSYLDARALAVFQAGDADFRRASWSVYHNLHMCRLGVCPNWLWSLDVFSLSTPTAIIHSCPVCFDPQLPNPQIFPARSIAVASAQFQVRDPTVEREGPVLPNYGSDRRTLALYSGVTILTGGPSPGKPLVASKR
eukprot:scaffold9114_cov118-Isochrysis_galbana.AAC.25